MALRRHPIVLCYHAVSPSWATNLAVTPDLLADHAKSLLDRGRRPATLSTALSSDDPGRYFVVTFDDGFESVYTQAFPVLQELGVPATVFVCTEFVTNRERMAWPAIAEWNTSTDRDELYSLSWDQARELSAAGWEIGSHTCTHPLLTTLDDERLDHELRASKEECAAQLDRPCTAFAYPQSDQNRRIRDRVAAAGYDWACTLPYGLTPPERYAWPRIGAYQSDAPLRFRVKSSQLISRFRSTRLGHAVERYARRLPESDD